MPRKLGNHRSYGEKLISLFARMLFTGTSYSLTDLSKMLGCSKQSVIRLVNDIRMAYSVDIEEYIQGNRKYYRMVKPGKVTPVIPMTESELTALQMCKTFTEHLLGDQFYHEGHGLWKKTFPWQAVQLVCLLGTLHPSARERLIIPLTMKRSLS